MSTETAIDIVRARLDAAMKQKGASAKGLARTAGLGETVVRDIIQAKTRDIQLGTIEKLARALGLPLGDLLPETQGGGAAASVDLLPDNDDDVEIQQWDVSYGMGGGSFHDLPVTGERHKFSRSWLRQFTSAPPEKIFLADGTGDSMFPTILDADKVMIDTTQREVRMSDRIWAAAYGQVGIIKRLRPSPDGSVKILSDNPSVPPDTAYDGELFIVGRVVAILRKV